MMTGFQGDAAACNRKRRFKSRTAAKKQAKRHRRDGSYCVEYECPNCGHWHVTSMDQRVRRQP